MDWFSANTCRIPSPVPAALPSCPSTRELLPLPGRAGTGRAEGTGTQGAHPALQHRGTAQPQTGQHAPVAGLCSALGGPGVVGARAAPSLLPPPWDSSECAEGPRAHGHGSSRTAAASKGNTDSLFTDQRWAPIPRSLHFHSLLCIFQRGVDHILADAGSRRLMEAICHISQGKLFKLTRTLI